MRQELYWSAHLLRHSPALVWQAAPLALAARLRGRAHRPQIFVATHHKALTVFLARVFRAFARTTQRSWDMHNGPRLDYGCEVLIDRMSRPRWDLLGSDCVGLHVLRDPRDLIVSSGHYHARSKERWLHRACKRFGGLSYQQKLRALPDLEARLLFEIEHISGDTIRDMLAWKSERRAIVDVRYDDLVGPKAARNFDRIIAPWPLSPREKGVLGGLFRYFAIEGPGTSKHHVRNPRSGQWQDHFTARVSAEFDRQFPGAIAKLGFDPPDKGMG